MDFLINYYVWIKALHFLGFISWMAALFYLPRLFVYHAENMQNKGFVDVVKVQERKLFFAISTPAMFVTIITGSLMLFLNPTLLQTPHIHAKLTFALLMLLFYLDNFRYLKQLQKDTCKKSGKFFRAYNEIPTLLLLAILISFASAEAL